MTKHADTHDEEHRSTGVLPALPLILSHPDAAAPARGCAGCGDSMYPPYNPFEHMEEEEKRRRKREKHNHHTEHSGDCRDEHSGHSRSGCCVGMSMGMAAVADTIMNTAMNPGGN